MKTRYSAVLAAASVLALAACNKQPAAAADAISGTWKADAASVQFDQQPDVYLLKDGQYTCSSCAPPTTVAADGVSHPIAGSPYFDGLAVKVVDDHNITLSRKKGDRVVGEYTRAVSSDGNTLTGTYKDMSTENAPPVTGKFTETRVAPAPAGSHLTSGSWKPDKVESVSDEGATVTYKLAGDTLSMSSPAGQSYTAKLDGSDVPIQGDPTGVVASVERTGDNAYRETDKRGGKVIGVATFDVGADGKLHVAYDDKERNSVVKYTADKQ